jgi:hypothetical protein
LTLRDGNIEPGFGQRLLAEPRLERASAPFQRGRESSLPCIEQQSWRTFGRSILPYRRLYGPWPEPVDYDPCPSS